METENLDSMLEAEALDPEIPLEFPAVPGATTPLLRPDLSRFGLNNIYRDTSVPSKPTDIPVVNQYYPSLAANDTQEVRSPLTNRPGTISDTKAPTLLSSSKPKRRGGRRLPSIQVNETSEKSILNTQLNPSPGNIPPISNNNLSIKLEILPFNTPIFLTPTPTPLPKRRFRSPSVTPQDTPKSNKLVPCTVTGCRAVLANKSLMTRHRRGTHGDKKECRYCRKMIGDRADYLKKHARVCRMRPMNDITQTR